MTRRSAKVVQLVPANAARPAPGQALALLNAARGAVSRHAVLPWEDAAAFQALADALMDEYDPAGPTEHHLVHELASVIWRRRRLELAEGAAFAVGIRKATASYSNTAADAVAHLGVSIRQEAVDFESVLTCTAEETARELRAERAAAEKARRAFQHLGGHTGRMNEAPDAYRKALDMLAPGTRDSWLEEDPTETSAALHEWLGETVPELFGQVSLIERRGAIRAQTIGAAFDPDKLDRLAAHEAHLDRKLERTIAMLVKLRELRTPRAQ